MVSQLRVEHPVLKSTKNIYVAKLQLSLLQLVLQSCSIRVRKALCQPGVLHSRQVEDKDELYDRAI